MIDSRQCVPGSNSMALGCSHTYGIGVEAHEAWPYLLGANNFGKPGISADYLIRIAPELITTHKPTVIYMLWPDWSRFEYVQDGKYHQSLSTDTNRINFMESHPTSWLLDNFQKHTRILRSLCDDNRIQLVDMTLYDLIPYIDHADTWPISQLGHHYAASWHQSIADIFKNAQMNNIEHALSNV